MKGSSCAETKNQALGFFAPDFPPLPFGFSKTTPFASASFLAAFSYISAVFPATRVFWVHRPKDARFKEQVAVEKR